MAIKTDPIFKRAPVNQEDGGSISLTKGQAYFFESTPEVLSDNEEDAIAIVKGLGIKDILKNDRGFIMVALVPPENIVVPNEIARSTGFFYEMPPGYSLTKVQTELYGESPYKAESVFEFLENIFPGILEKMISGAETVKEVVDESVKQVTGKSSEVAKAVVTVAASLLGLYLVIKLIKK